MSSSIADILGLLLGAVVFNGIGFLFLRWPAAGAKSLESLQDDGLMPFQGYRITIWTARLFGLEMAVGGLGCTAVLVYAIVVGITGSNQ